MSRLTLLALALCATAVLATNDTSTWTCTGATERTVVPGVVLRQANCTGQTPSGQVGPLVFSIAIANLSMPGINAVPGRADPSAQLANITEISKSVPGAVAGINGGYFFRVDVDHFIDNVCWFKTRKEALAEPNTQDSNDGLADGLLLVNGSLWGSNCDCLGYNRPTTMVLDGVNSYIEIQYRGDPAPTGAVNAIAAGPNLVSLNKEGVPEVDIPLDDHNVNIVEHSANAAIGLYGDEEGSTFLALAVSNGYDGCKPENPTCGTDAKKMAYFMKDYVKCETAMEMDQGGSAVLWTADEGPVSNPGAGLRPLYGALFITADSEM